MARPAQYTAQGILDAAAELAAVSGPAKTTLGAIAESLDAPTGSIYHRFRSKDVLLAELWLQTVESFQTGFQAALAGAEPRAAGLDAALHTPRWVRSHPVPARLLLLHNREDFVAGVWPAEVIQRASEVTERGQAALDSFTRRVMRSTSAPARRRARFAVVELPVAAVLPHLRADERPPPSIERLIADAYHGVIENPRGNQGSSEMAARFASAGGAG
ncbi:MAG TPA: helix-turn-helix domain-containing protein [Solirubrobacteraceae bacterium]